MTYQNIRFIAYAVGTMPQKNGDGTKTYLGLPPDPADAPHTADIDARCALMLRAIQTAAAQLPTQSPPAAAGTLLNVFMAPEFFFRGPLGAYSMDEVAMVTGQLQAMVKGPEWVDWLFVFGSILGYASQTRDTPPYDIDPALPKEVYNFTLTQQGGLGDTPGIGAHAILKELKSTADFISSSATPDALLTGNVEYLGAGNSGAGREQQQVAYDGAGIFTQAGITWGVEICLDHYSNLQNTGRLQRSPQLPGEQQIQVQLVPSGGMSIHDPQTMAMPGGFVFNCDGYGNGSARLKQVTAAGAPAPALTDIAALGSYAVDGGDIAVDTSPPTPPVGIAQLYPSGAGNIVLFGPVAIPAAATVGGRALTASWLAKDAYRFDFKLVYDAANQFQAALCKITSTRKDFYDRQYFLPLKMRSKDKAHADIRFNISFEGPVVDPDDASGFANSIRCQVVTREFSCDGVFLAFNDTFSGPDSTSRTFW